MAKTGRPVRSNAGKRSLPTGFVSIDQAYVKIEEEGQGISSDSEVEDQDDDEPTHNKRRRSSYGPRPKTSKRPRLTKRKSPPPPPLSPEPEEVFEDLSSRPSSPEPGDVKSKTLKDKICLTINVPPGHEGPIVVNLSISDLLKDDVLPILSPLVKLDLASKTYSHRHRTNPKHSCSTAGGCAPANESSVGFLCLPGELRNIVYRRLFVKKDPIEITRADDSQLSCAASFLATCTQIYREGREILYSENRFKITRQCKQRGRPFSRRWPEVGYKDARLFLTMIGPSLSFIRHLYIVFEDGFRAGDYSKPPDSFKYVNDEHLRQCLRLLAKKGNLETFCVTFSGRRILVPANVEFIHALKRVRADKFHELSWMRCDDNHRNTLIKKWGVGAHSRMTQEVKDELINKIQRKTPSYPKNETEASCENNAIVKRAV